MSRCCARCRTPYNCGDKTCWCHPQVTDELRLRIEAQASRDAYEIDYALGLSDGETGVTSLFEKQRRKR